MAGTGDLADFGELLAHFGGGGQQPLGGQRLDMGGDLGAVPGVPVGTAPVLFVAGLYVPGAVGVVRPCPALFVVPSIAQRIKQPLMTRWGDIQRSARGQLHAGGQRVDVHRAVVVTVQHGTGGVLVGIEASERRRLPILDDLLDLFGGRLVIGCPCDDARRVAPLVGAGVSDLGDQERVAPQHRHFGADLSSVVVLLEQIPHGTAGAALAVGQKLYVHGASVPSSSGS